MNKNRKEKIKFLKEVLKGEKKIHELLPSELLVFHFKDETQTYYCEKLKREFKEEEFKEFQKKFPQYNSLVIERVIISSFLS